MSHTSFKLLIGEQGVEKTASNSIFSQFLDIASVAVIRLSVFKKHVHSVIIFYFQRIDTVHTLFGALNRWIMFGNEQTIALSYRISHKPQLFVTVLTRS